MERASKAIAIAIVSAALETVSLVMIAKGLSLRIELVHALAIFAASIAGALWGLRSGALAAALAPFASSLFVLAPVVALGGRPAPVLATAAVLALFAPLVERAWTVWVEGAARTPSMLATVAPVCSLGMLSASAVGTPYLAFATMVVCASLFALHWTRARRSVREVSALAAYVRSVEIGVDAISKPDPPALSDRELVAIERALAARLDTLAFVASADARARDQIADARQLRTRFMASMSHELRSPLNSIVGFAEILGRGMEGALTPEQRESVALIRRSAEELIMLLTDILDLARLEAGKLVLTRSWVPSVEILTEAVGRARPTVEGRDVDIQVEMQPGLPPVHVDKKRIVQAVVALFRNAAPRMRKTRVKLRARIAEGPPGPARHLRIEISDVAGAIGFENVERIFEAFQEITVPTGRRVGGLGMALSLARGLVRLHGGEVWAEPMLEGGTVLCVAIPLGD